MPQIVDFPVQANVHTEGLSKRKQAIREISDRYASIRDEWIERNRAFHDDDWRYMRFLIPAGARVLELGCGTGALLSALEPSRGVGIDLSPRMIERARQNHPELEFHCGDIEDRDFMATIEGPFDAVVLSDTIGSIEDCQELLTQLHRLSTPETRLVIAYFNQLWRPLLWLGVKLRQRMPSPSENWLSIEDLTTLQHLADWEMIKTEKRQLIPVRIFGLDLLANKVLAPLPFIRHLCLRHYVVARSRLVRGSSNLSCSVVVPCRNERGNIEAAVQRLPKFCDDLEIIFVEGHSQDGTLDECYRVRDRYADRDIKVVVQDGVGKGDAVRKGFALARGDVLIIMDADLTTPPETIPKFYTAIASGKGEFINGTRLVYPMASGAMRFLNYLANRTFALLFSWLLGERLTDTLCGTKALTKRNYEKIENQRGYFSGLDPFGDFDLILGAAKVNLKISEVPIRYTERVYGTTQISRFSDGWRLARMFLHAFRFMKVL
ncbi:MAG: glycosyltransferase [Alphaproteobacteria bacterium]